MSDTEYPIEGRVSAGEEEYFRVRTPEKQPKGPSTNFALNEVQALVRRLLVHAKSDGDVRCLAECSVLRCIVALAEVVYRVTAQKKTSHGEGCVRQTVRGAA